MATCKMLGFDSIPDGARFVFAASTAQEVSQELASYFAARGYRFEGGSALEGSYGIGSDVMRILFGALAKRLVFAFKIVPQGQGCHATVYKAISGAWGGVIGYRRMNKELETIIAELSARFA